MRIGFVKKDFIPIVQTIIIRIFKERIRSEGVDLSPVRQSVPIRISIKGLCPHFDFSTVRQPVPVRIGKESIRQVIRNLKVVREPVTVRVL